MDKDNPLTLGGNGPLISRLREAPPLTAMKLGSFVFPSLNQNKTTDKKQSAQFSIKNT